MNLEKIFELLSKNPDNFSIEYTNINGNEKLIVNGEDLTEEENLDFDDSKIKAKIVKYKKNVAFLDEYIWDLVIEEAERRDINLVEMDKILSLDKYTEKAAMQADNTIDIMNNIIVEILKQEIQNLMDQIERF